MAEDINRSVLSVRDVADQSAAAAQQTAASTVQLARLGGELQARRRASGSEGAARPLGILVASGLAAGIRGLQRRFFWQVSPAMRDHLPQLASGAHRCVSGRDCRQGSAEGATAPETLRQKDRYHR